EPGDFLLPSEASDADLMRVHTAEWIGKLRNGTLTASEIMKLEVPYSPELAKAVWLAAGGSILAGQCALRDGLGCNLGGGFHHAFADHGGGVCAIHDLAGGGRPVCGGRGDAQRGDWGSPVDLR